MPALDYDVVIPTHGRRLDLLGEAIDSVAAQTVPPRGIIVVVDGNPEAATRLEQDSPRVQVVRVDPARGEAAARQRGIEQASAEWVCFLDDDDLWAAHKQEAMAEYVAAHPDCQAVCAGFWTFAAPDDRVTGINGQVIELRADSLAELEALARTTAPQNDLDYLDIGSDSLGCLLEYNRGNIGTAMVKRAVLERAPTVPQGQRPGADHLLFCGVATRTPWHLVKERLMFYRLHGGQDTRTPDPYGGRSILTAITTAWHWSDGVVTRPITSYGPRYRQDLRRLLWPLLRKHEWRVAVETFRSAQPLLPRRRDRVLALVPEPLVWRVRHRLLRRDTDSAPRSPSW